MHLAPQQQRRAMPGAVRGPPPPPPPMQPPVPGLGYPGTLGAGIVPLTSGVCAPMLAMRGPPAHALGNGPMPGGRVAGGQPMESIAAHGSASNLGAHGQPEPSGAPASTIMQAGVPPHVHQQAHQQALRDGEPGGTRGEGPAGGGSHGASGPLPHGMQHVVMPDGQVMLQVVPMAGGAYAQGGLPHLGQGGVPSGAQVMRGVNGVQMFYQPQMPQPHGGPGGGPPGSMGAFAGAFGGGNGSPNQAGSQPFMPQQMNFAMMPNGMPLLPQPHPPAMGGGMGLPNAAGPVHFGGMGMPGGMVLSPHGYPLLAMSLAPAVGMAGGNKPGSAPPTPTRVGQGMHGMRPSPTRAGATTLNASAKPFTPGGAAAPAGPSGAGPGLSGGARPADPPAPGLDHAPATPAERPPAPARSMAAAPGGAQPGGVQLLVPQGKLLQGLLPGAGLLQAPQRRDGLPLGPPVAPPLLFGSTVSLLSLTCCLVLGDCACIPRWKC